MCRYYRSGYPNAFCKAIKGPISGSKETREYCMNSDECPIKQKKEYWDGKFREFLKSRGK